MRTTLRDGSLESRVLNDMRTRSDVEKGNDSQSDVTSDKSYSSAATTAKREWIRISPDSPRNWPTWRKWWLIVGLQFYCTIIFIAADGFITDQAQVQYGVGEQVSILGQSMYILGIAVGPMFLAALSEIYGRQPIYTTGFFFFALLQIPSALSPTFAGVVVTRFLVGCVAGLPISNIGASAADLFPTSQTAWPVILFSFTSQAFGPDLGPVIGSAYYVRTGSLHWFYWMILILGMIAFVWCLTFGETLHDKMYEKYTGVKNNKSATAAVGGDLFSAFHMLVTPIVIALALTTTYLFGLVIIYIEGLPLVYEDGYGFNPVVGGAMFLVGIGGGIAALATQPLQDWMYRRSAQFTSDGTPRPEARLYTACFSVWVLPASILWFAFTSTHPSTTSYQIPMWSGFLFGYAEVATYASVWQYVTDAYGEYAGSALAAANLPAHGISAGLAHHSIIQSMNQGTKWALVTLGLISLGFLVVPPLLVWKGSALRRRSKYASSGGPTND